LQGQLRPPEGVGRVELVRPVARDVDLEVTRQREQGDRVPVGVEAKQHGRVGEPIFAADLVVSLVGAEDHDRLRAAAWRLQEGLDAVEDAAVLEGIGDVREIEDQARRGGAGDRRDDHQGGCEKPQPHREADVPANGLEA
jgi:hypothetical protein